nr:hypothetical protein [Hyphomonas sp. Mor2]
MKRIILPLLISPLIVFSSAAEDPVTVSVEDLSVVIGTEWTGSLTYLNYGEPVKDFTIPAEIDVAETEGGFKFSFQYPDEPHANSTSLTGISADGTQINGETVVANALLDTGAREIRTTSSCKDMGKAATCEMIYTLGSKTFEMRKMVTYEGETDAFRRNVFSFTR